MKATAWMLAFAAGFMSLSVEILWVRLIGFAHFGVPQAFAFVLVVFLAGVALGAVLGKRFCTGHERALGAAGVALLLAGAIDIATPWLIAASIAGPFAFLAKVVLILTSAALKAVAFPIAHHLGSSDAGGKLGRSLSRVYFFNIIGSTLGPIVFGFFLLDFISLQAGFTVIGLFCVAVGALLVARLRAAYVFYPLAGLAVVASFLVDHKSSHLVRVMAGEGDALKVHYVVENRQGIIHTTEGESAAEGDAVFGGNVYDGRTNVDLLVNSNRIDRAYLLTSLTQAPKNILVLGLSTGAWTRVVSAIPGVERIDVVEINPGYLELIKRYPSVSPLLDDKRVSIHIDDGRRWLKRNPGARYDLVVMNTSFHWRANSTNLLSRNFLQELKGHMTPQAILAFNSTRSPDVLETAANVFPHAYRWMNFIYCADFDFREPGADVQRQRLAQLSLEGRPLLDFSRERDRQALAAMRAQQFETVDQVAAKTGRPLEIITDDNMITEYKYGMGF